MHDSLPGMRSHDSEEVRAPSAAPRRVMLIASTSTLEATTPEVRRTCEA